MDSSVDTTSSCTGPDSWPLAYFEFLTLTYNSSSAINCEVVQDVLLFLAWAQFNDEVRTLSPCAHRPFLTLLHPQASVVAEEQGYVPLSNHFRKR